MVVNERMKKMKQKSFDDLELPEGTVEATASVADDSQKAGVTGAPVSVDNEAEPAPASSNSPLEEDARVNEAFRKVEILAKIEPLLNSLYNRLKTIVEIGNSIKQIAGSTVARYLVTDQQVLRFKAAFIQHFDEDLQKQAQKQLQKYLFDLENARNEEVHKFNQEIKNGWWFSNKVGWFLYMRPPLAPEPQRRISSPFSEQSSIATISSKCSA